MKQLIDLLKATPIERMEGNSQVRIIDVTADSRAVETGSLFFCLRGEHVDGHNFANMAAENGAAAIIAEKKIDVFSDVTIIYVADTRKAMEDIVPYFLTIPLKNENDCFDGNKWKNYNNPCYIPYPASCRI